MTKSTKEICEEYKNSQKPYKRQSDHHRCFLKKFNFDFLNYKDFENQTINSNTRDMEENEKNI